MNIYDKINELAAALKDNEDVVAFRNAAKKIEADETKTKMLGDFRKIQIDAYNESVASGKVSQETTERMQNFASVIEMNPDINEYLQAEMRFSILYQDMMKIISDAIGVNVMDTEE